MVWYGMACPFYESSGMQDVPEPPQLRLHKWFRREPKKKKGHRAPSGMTKIQFGFYVTTTWPALRSRAKNAT